MNILHFLKIFWSKKEVSINISVFKNKQFFLFLPLNEDGFADSPFHSTVVFELITMLSIPASFWNLKFPKLTKNFMKNFHYLEYREAKFKTSLRVGFFLDLRNFTFASSSARIERYS